MKDSANASTVAWLASECRRARYQEEQLRAAVERRRRKDVQPSDD
jgi:membrane-bound lytic murein transglycosylase B